jgi:hypothetical protein
MNVRVEFHVNLIVSIGLLMYNFPMTKKIKSLIETNPYLRDPKKREESLIWSVATSTAIETGENPESIAKRLRKYRDRARHIKRKATPKAVKARR